MELILSGALTVIIYIIIYILGGGVGGGFFRHSIKLEKVGLTVFKFQSISIHRIELIVSVPKYSVK